MVIIKLSSLPRPAIVVDRAASFFFTTEPFGDWAGDTCYDKINWLVNFEALKSLLEKKLICSFIPWKISDMFLPVISFVLFLSRFTKFWRL